MKIQDNNEGYSEGSAINHQRTIKDGRISELLETLLLTLAISGLWYYCYYLLAPWIWRQNIHFKIEDITPLMQISIAQEGVEVYALYIMAFVNIVSAFVLSIICRHITRKSLRRFIVALSALVSTIYCATIGFIPPVNSFQDTPLSRVIWQSLLITVVVFSLIAFLYCLQRYSPKLGLTMTTILLVPACFIATSGISQIDYYFIFAPALRLLNGSSISDIYFRYDLLLSLLAATWIKLELDMNTFQVISQAGYYIAILVTFIFSGKLFQKKELSIFLLIALVLGRLYADPWDVNLCFQVNPLRLDLWLPLLLVVYRWGPYHWSAGLLLGLLVLFHKNFGTIYSIAYIQLLITLCAIEFYDKERRVTFTQSLADLGKRCSIPVAILVVFSFASYFLFQNKEYGNYNNYFLKLGIDFIKIARNSFYWYVPALLSTVAILLVRLRKRVSVPYLTTGILLVYCAIGNSIYFFGRSHEHNILNISVVLLFLFFFMLDLMSRILNESTGKDTPITSFVSRQGSVCVASVLIIVITASYSANIVNKTQTQITNISEGKRIYDFNYVRDSKFTIYVNQIRVLTDYSPKVYFIDNEDFLFCYYCGYEPVGFCSPFISWIFKIDQNRFLQGLLDKGYYLVCRKKFNYVLDELHYNDHIDVGGHIIVTKRSDQAPKS